MRGKRLIAALLAGAAITAATAASASATTVWTLRASAAPGVMVAGVDLGSVTGTPVLMTLSAANATATQWQFRRVPGATPREVRFQLYSAFVDRCVAAYPAEDPLPSYGDVSFQKCQAGSAAQAWRLFIPTGTGGKGPITLPGGSVTSPYWLRNVYSGECLWVPAAHYAELQPLFDTAPCSMAGSRLWRLSRGEI